MASTATAGIPRLIEAVNEHMEALNYVEDPRRVAGHTILAVTTFDRTLCRLSSSTASAA